jgi:protein CpxP
MSQQTESPSNESNPSESPKHQQRRGRRWMLAGAAAAVIGAFSIVGITHATDGPGCGGRHGMGMGLHGDALNPEMAAQHIDRMIAHLLPDGTVEQKAKVAAIAKAAMTDLLPLREQHRAARAQGIKLLTAPTIDRAALEQIRASQVQLADQLSKRIAQALADTAEVLTPEQRAALADRLQKRMGHHG